MDKDNFYLNQCRAQIEQKLHWRDSNDWQNQDFERLSALVFEQTGTSLSTSTLKRIWGKIRYVNSPNMATLDALAQFAGHANWSAFTANGFQPDEYAHRAEKILPKTSLPKRGVSWRVWTGLAVIVLLASLLAIGLYAPKGKPLSFKNIQFSSQPVAVGVPNSVVFNYNAAESNADSVFIQQNWDKRRRFRVDKNAHQFVSTYYRPGYFRAKLVLNDSVVLEHDLYIETDGWLGTFDGDLVPVYFTKTEVEKNGIIGLNEMDLAAKEIDLSNKTAEISFFKVEKSMSVPDDNFSMEMELKNTCTKSDGICRHTRIILFGDEGHIALPLSIKGCAGELAFTVAGEHFEGENKDLSAFGVDFNDYANIRCTCRNGYYQIFVNQKLAYEGKPKGKVGRILGTRIIFQGTGEIRRFDLRGL